MPVLRLASLALVALWSGGLAALELIAVPAADLERFRNVAWICGGGTVALLIIRTLLGPRPRRLSFQLGLVAVMLAANLMPAVTLAVPVIVAGGLAVTWIEISD